MTRLRGSLVGAGLEPDHPVPALPDLLLREVPLVLGGHLGAQGGTGVLRVFLCYSGQGVETQTNLQAPSRKTLDIRWENDRISSPHLRQVSSLE